MSSQNEGVADGDRPRPALYNDKRINDFIQQINAGIAYTTTQGVFMHVNDRYCSIVGYSREELLHMNMLQLTHPDDIAYNLGLFKDCVEYGRGFHIEKRYIHKDGKIVWVNNSVSLIDDDTEGTYIVAVCVDITDSKHKEELLQYRKALLEAQNEAVPDAILIVDARGTVLSHNRHFAALWQIPKQVLDAGDDAAVLQHIATKVQDPQAYIDRVKYCYANLDKSAHEEVALLDGRIIERYGNAVVGDNGKNYGWIWFFRDITDRRLWERALKESEERYQNFIRQSTEGIWRFEFDVPVTMHTPASDLIDYFFDHAYLAECNDAMAQMYGFDHAVELTGRKLSDFFPRDEDSESYFRAFIESGYRLQSVESKEMDRYGNTRYFMNNLVGIVEDEMLIRAWGTQREITAERAAEEKLRESEERFRTIANETPAFVFMSDEEAHVQFVNKYWLEFAGVSQDSGAGLTWSEVTHPDDIEPMLNTYRNAVARLIPYHFEIRQKGVDGLYHWILWRGIPRVNADGSFQGILGVGIDITDRKEAEEALRAAKENIERQKRLYDTVTNSTPDLIYVFDLNYRFTYANQALLEMWGKSWDEAIGKGLIENGYEKWHAEMHEREIDQVVSTKRQIRGEVSFPHAVLGKRVYDYIFAPVLNDKGEVEAIAGTTRDITEIRKAEELLREGSERLEALVAERTRELQRSNEDLMQFAHVASHDLKEPVRKIMTFGNRLKSEYGPLLPAEANVYIDKMEKASRRIYSMIDGVLLYSSLGSIPQLTEQVDLGVVLRDVETDLEILIQQKSARIEFDKLPLLQGSPILIYQLFYNLVNNSIKFGKEGLPPVVRIFEEKDEDDGGRFTRIVVQDNGIGFRASESEAIFGTFVRLHSKDRYEGTGLGLSLCRTIMERHGGTIRAEGEGGVGARFILRFPINSEAWEG